MIYYHKFPLNGYNQSIFVSDYLNFLIGRTLDLLSFRFGKFYQNELSMHCWYLNPDKQIYRHTVRVKKIMLVNIFRHVPDTFKQDKQKN